MEGNWYKGNLHSHTTKSDGPLSPEKTVKYYQKKNYQFLCISDHGIITEVKNIKSEDFLVLKGAEFSGITLETNREDFLLSLLRDNTRYLKTHLDELSGSVELKKNIVITGGGAGIEGMIPIKKRWMGSFEYRHEKQSSLTGAAMLGQFYLQGLFR